MLEDEPRGGDAAEDPRRGARGLASGFGALLALTVALMVLGALVRAHGAGLACPDWPLCFGELLPPMDLEVGFEWTHRLVAGAVALLFVGLAALCLRRPGTRRATARLLAVGAVLLAAQILLGALTVWKLLADWTVTAHLVTGSAFAVCLLWLTLELGALARGTRPRRAAPAVRGWLAFAAALLLAQLVLGGLVSSRFAGMACPEWPACNGGVWFPSWRGAVGLHLLHRMNAYALLAVLAVAALVSRGAAGVGSWAALALAIAVAQVLVGIANVALGIPVEVTAAHSALAAALVLTVALALHRAWSSETA